MSLAGRTFSSLAIRDYRWFFAGNVLSLLGFWIRLTVQGWLVYELTDSKLLLTVVTAVSMAPLLVLGPTGGLLGDRLNRRTILMTLPVFSVVANVFLAIVIIRGDVTVGHIIAASAVIGCARAVEIPVRNAFVRDVVGMHHLRNAVALNAAGFNVARVAGPALGAGLLVLLDYGPCFLAAAALNLTMTLTLLRVRVPRTERGATEDGAWRQLREGYRFVRGHPRTRTVFTLFAITIIFAWSYQVLMPAYAKDQLGLNDVGYMLLLSALGLGALLGALWVAGRAETHTARRRFVFGLVWAGAACVFALGFVQTVWLAGPILFLTGFCQVSFFATSNGMVQESVPDALRGRVMGLWIFTFGLSMPLGSLLMGGISEAFSIPWALCGGAVLMFLLSAYMRWRLPPPTPAESEAADERAPQTTEEGPGVTDAI